MKQLLLFLFVFPYFVFSQCPPDGAFHSQAEIDAFAMDYPNCTMLDVALIISGDDITDLSGLAQITACTSLSISNNAVLQNTDGLNSNLVLSYVEGTGNGFGVSNNPSLVAITGLENLVNQSGFESAFSISNNPMLTSVAGVPNTFNTLASFYIINNDALTNLVGLENYGAGEFTVISDNDNLIDFTGLNEIYGSEFVHISNNDALESFNGLLYLGSEHSIIIENNAVLEDINIGSNNIIGNWPEVIIRNNSSLSFCNANWVCSYLYLVGVEESSWFPGTFENNAPGCNTNFEVEYGCELASNDNCSEAYYSSSYHINLGETLIANNEFATTSFQTPTCNDVANRQDVWFAFYTGDSTTIDLITQAGFNMQIWENGYCFGEETNPVAGGCGSAILEDIPVVSNTSYLVQVWSDNAIGRTSGWFDILLQDGSLSTPDYENSTIHIYPNPVQNELQITSNLTIDTIQIFNLLGQNVLETNVKTLNVSNLKTGMYLVKVISNQREFTYKIVKQ
ncbi:T9SS type A sorting domain-containing protein [Oceanihabitans sp. 2_MG-2023]|uniref:T9SS type A sorting domain-containing protein n=1 Tax=Oceanihabitans sp. 2_MG-2023 TaxID=3062661 RepID=UPI0026E16D9B|nr:T9SS type A sorting domain-containing protein [Oceanihabitans sp. 2_MG-2023]MDO6598417.1 T9SS type A sorting domain-containing protein [Oceanihabitans sp. 2_MG-2023]